MLRDVRQQFSGHAKRVTLNLARCSAVCAAMPELKVVLDKLPSIDFDLKLLDKDELELLYAEFDEDLEESIRNEFMADPNFLIDLGVANGTCPLCGHKGCRFIFKLRNLKDEVDINCGSECIITYGLSVQGAETAEHAKKLLEKAIRDAIKKVKIETWHTEYGFEADFFSIVSSRLRGVRADIGFSDWDARNEAIYLVVELEKLRKFYDKNGWLNTKIRWGKWLRVVNFVVARDAGAADLLPTFKPWEDPKKVKVEKVGTESGTEKPIIPESTKGSQLTLEGVI